MMSFVKKSGAASGLLHSRVAIPVEVAPSHSRTYHCLNIDARRGCGRILSFLFRFLTAGASRSTFFVHIVERALPDHPNHAQRRRDEVQCNPQRQASLQQMRLAGFVLLSYSQSDVTVDLCE